ncbi:MAG: hypothetical protein SFT91_01905 [Rickettsiaceae bacterium]|nr:hypothetical protein [Rickettsiaceae bacterium]
MAKQRITFLLNARFLAISFFALIALVIILGFITKKQIKSAIKFKKEVQKVNYQTLQDSQRADISLHYPSCLVPARSG